MVSSCLGQGTLHSQSLGSWNRFFWLPIRSPLFSRPPSWLKTITVLSCCIILGSGIQARLGRVILLSHVTLIEVAGWYAAGGQTDREGPSQLQSHASAGMSRSLARLELGTMVLPRDLSSMVASDLLRDGSDLYEPEFQRRRQRPQRLFDSAWEVTRCHFHHHFLLKTVTNLPRFKGRDSRTQF